MSTKTIHLIVFLAFLIHGIGHFQGVVSSFGVNIGKSGGYKSWLLKSQSDKTNKTICFILYFLSAVGFLIVAASFKGWLFDASLWKPLAFITAIISVIALIFFWNALAMFFNKAGAIIVNAFCLFSIYLIKWPASLFD
jgi:hypothetical protein